MKLRQKVIFLAITPLILALCAIALFVRHQAITLAQQQRDTIQQAYLASKEAELNITWRWPRTRSRTCTAPASATPATLDEAKRILSTAELRQRRLLFRLRLPGQQPDASAPARAGRAQSVGPARRQRRADHPAPDRRAQRGGGLERYNWAKPSTNKTAPKLGYVIPMPTTGAG